jgi:predicted nucleic acid-binding protein
VTVYLDTSSLVKLYVAEQGSDEVRQFLAAARAAATSALTYVEARAAFARRYREKELERRDYAMVRRDLDADWPGYISIDVSSALCRSAGELAEQYRLKSLDAIHLASFAELASTLWPDAVEFHSFDRRLNRAASSAVRSLKRARKA